MQSLKQKEELKRRQAIGSVEEWQNIQQVINWALANMRPECRKDPFAHEKKINASFQQKNSS